MADMASQQRISIYLGLPTHHRLAPPFQLLPPFPFPFQLSPPFPRAFLETVVPVSPAGEPADAAAAFAARSALFASASHLTQLSRGLYQQKWMRHSWRWPSLLHRVPAGLPQTGLEGS